MFISIKPIGKPRMTQRDKWSQRPAVLRYHAFCDELRLRYKGTLPTRVELTFYIPMSDSWSKRRKENQRGTPHQMKPDIDNLVKATLDALSLEDSYIWEIHAAKFWTDSSGMGIEITDL
jgi:Holliday junction resolvase RusA-like endonuclease